MAWRIGALDGAGLDPSFDWLSWWLVGVFWGSETRQRATGGRDPAVVADDPPATTWPAGRLVEQRRHGPGLVQLATGERATQLPAPARRLANAPAQRYSLVVCVLEGSSQAELASLEAAVFALRGSMDQVLRSSKYSSGFENDLKSRNGPGAEILVGQIVQNWSNRVA